MEYIEVMAGPIIFCKVSNENKKRTSKVGAISKAQKAQNNFFGKNLNFSKFLAFGKGRTVPKNVKGGPF